MNSFYIIHFSLQVIDLFSLATERATHENLRGFSEFTVVFIVVMVHAIFHFLIFDFN